MSYVPPVPAASLRFVPASQMADMRAAKILVYGPPGTAKTPLLGTAPRPVLCAIEDGCQSLQGATFAATAAKTTGQIEAFATWAEQSSEIKQYDTIGIDSLSQLAETYLNEEAAIVGNGGKKRDGKQVYGDMSVRVRNVVRRLLAIPEKHVYFIAKQSMRDHAETMKCHPMFPGKDLTFWIPHEMDQVLHIDRRTFPGTPGFHLCFQTQESPTVVARDRSGKLDLYEPAHLGQLIRKITGK